MPLILQILVHRIIDPLVTWPLTRLSHALRELWISIRTSDWNVTQGTVVRLHAKQEYPFWHVWLVYRYSAESHTFLAVWHRVLVFEKEVDRFMDKHPRGSQVTLRYCPGTVGRPVILDADQTQPIIEGRTSTARTGASDHRSPNDPITRFFSWLAASA